MTPTTTTENRFRSRSAFAAWRDTGRAGPRGAALRASTRLERSAAIVAASGEVDASNVRSWARLLREMAKAARPPGPFVVDVRDMAFLGCCAVASLAGEAQRCRRRGITLCLVSHQQVVARTVAICGLRWVLPIHPTVEAALAWPAAGLGGPCRSRT